MKTSFNLLARLLFFVPIVVNAQGDTAIISDFLNRQTDKAFKQYAFVVVRDGKTIYKKETAEFNIKTQQPIGASSQWLTAALVMGMVQDGKISLDDRVSQYIPNFEKYYKGYITIRHCLTHFTGIQVDKLFAKSKFKTLEDEVNDLATKREIVTNAGEESRYSNLGFLIAGRVLEIVSKKSFDRLFADRIGRLCNMKATTFTNEDYNDAINPATGARSSAMDYANFMTMLLNKGTFNNKPVLTPASVETLLKLQVEAGSIKNPPAFSLGSDYAFGAWVEEEGKTISAPSYIGSIPVLDLCRKSAYVLITKELSSPPAKTFYNGLKDVVDEALGGCK